MSDKTHTVKELIELISVTSYHYQMSKDEAEKLANAKSAPAWASRYAEQVLNGITEDEERKKSYSDR